MKALIFDSGTLINFSMNGLLSLIENLRKNFKGSFLITERVKYEIIDRPLGIARFELGALQIKALLDKKVIELPSIVDIENNALERRTKELTNTANHYLQIKGKWIPLVSEGEMSCLALSDELTHRGVENLIAIDERTTRMLAENPQNLQALMSEKLHQKITMKEMNMSLFAQYKFIRSAELAFVAYKKGLVDIKGKDVLQALLYATKFKGCAVSFEEIQQLKDL